MLVVINSLSDPGEPVPGPHCTFCAARLICGSARREAENAALAKLVELPTGEPAAELLTWIKRARSFFNEVEAFYKRLLERETGSIPGWTLEPGAVRRAIEDPVAAFERLIETFSVSEFLGYCTPSIPDLERAWAKKKGLPASQAKESLKRLLGDLLTERPNAPSLKAV